MVQEKEWVTQKRNRKAVRGREDGQATSYFARQWSYRKREEHRKKEKENNKGAADCDVGGEENKLRGP